MTKIRTLLFNPRLQLAVMFTVIAIYTTRCGDAYR